MKNFIFLISLSLLFLFGVKWMNMTSLTEDREEIVCTLDVDQAADQIQAFPFHLPDSDLACIDADSLPGQLRVIGRSQRQLSSTYSLLLKGITARMARCRLDIRFQSSKRVYTTLPRLCWSFSSEHYVFGMRRILI